MLWQRLNIGSRVNREVHARFWERAEAKFLRATRQALFSARLALACGVASVRSILLCQKPDAALLPLLKPFREVEVWLSDPTNPSICKRITD
jgi:hypothetical protein